MKLEGEKILLRALEPNDIDLLYEWENNEVVWKISDTLTPFSRFQIEQYLVSTQDIFSEKQLRMIICEKDQGTPVGCIDLFDFNPQHHRIGLGILIAEEEFRRKGFASEAIDLVVKYAFEILECRSVYCNVTEDNQGSLELFKKCAFKEVGRKKQWIRQGDDFLDEFLLQRMSHS